MEIIEEPPVNSVLGVGSVYGGYKVTDVLASGPQTLYNISNKVYEVTGGTGEIKVQGNSNIVLILNGTTRASGSSQLIVEQKAKVTLYLVGGTTNTFTSTWTGAISSTTLYAGIYVGADATLTIEGPGTLTATGGSGGAGIGGSYLANTAPGAQYRCGTIIINSGTVNATGGYGSAGIGGAINGSVNSIQINGGTVVAKSGAAGGSGTGGAASAAAAPLSPQNTTNWVQAARLS